MRAEFQKSGVLFEEEPYNCLLKVLFVGGGVRGGRLLRRYLIAVSAYDLSDVDRNEPQNLT